MIMELVRIQGTRGGGTEFQGELVSSASTYGPERARWFELKLWEHSEGGWVVDRASISVIYHASDTTCRRRDDRFMGTPTKVGDLPENAEPCGECKPDWPENMSADTMVRFEAPRHTVIHCPSAMDVIEAVTVDRSRPGSLFASGPATELLTIAAGKDPLIAGALHESGAVSSVKVE